MNLKHLTKRVEKLRKNLNFDKIPPILGVFLYFNQKLYKS